MKTSVLYNPYNKVIEQASMDFGNGKSLSMEIVNVDIYDEDEVTVIGQTPKLKWSYNDGVADIELNEMSIEDTRGIMRIMQDIVREMNKRIESQE